MNNGKKLAKSFDKKIFGVAGGIAEYLGIEAGWVRLALIILFLMFDYVFLAYLILAVVLSEASDEPKIRIMTEKDPSMVL